MVRSQRNTQASSCVGYHYTTSAAFLSILGFRSRFPDRTKETTEVVVSFVLALPIFPARLQASIFGASELNFRVRDGNGWTLTAINTNLLFLERKSKQKELYAFFFQEEGLRFNYRTLKTEQSNRRTQCKRLHSISSSQPETSGQALGLLVPVSSIHYCTSTSGLSTI